MKKIPLIRWLSFSPIFDAAFVRLFIFTQKKNIFFVKGVELTRVKGGCLEKITFVAKKVFLWRFFFGIREGVKKIIVADMSVNGGGGG